MVTTALIEFNRSRSDLREVMSDQAQTLLESLMVASGNAIEANESLEHTIQQRLLDNADIIRQLYEGGSISDAILKNLVVDHHLHRARIVRPDGHWLASSHTWSPEHDSLSPGRPDLTPIFNGETDTLYIGLRSARFEHGFRYAVAVATSDRSAVVVNLDAEDLLAFRRRVGFGPLLRNVAQHPEIVYVALQDPDQIIAAAGEISLLESGTFDPFLESSMSNQTGNNTEREIDLDSLSVLEAVRPFYYAGNVVGVFRLGMSLEPLTRIDARASRRLLLITLVILAIGFIVMTFIVARQNAETLENQVRAVETYSSRVIDNVGDGILVLDTERRIQTINRVAQTLFSVETSDVVGKPAENLLGDENCREFLESEAVRDQITCELPHGTVHLLAAKTTFLNQFDEANTILILHDQTRLRMLEDKVRHRERMHVMGALASGLAHEIRNPLNAVGTIVQHLRRDFEPKEDPEGFEELTTIVYNEVRRINDAVQHFLKIVRPEPVKPEPFELSNLLRLVEQEHVAMQEESGVRLTVRSLWSGTVQWDFKMMQQVFLNLVRNAFDACERGGRITIDVSRPEEDIIEIRTSDTGKGMSDKVRERIFNMYYTTKASGTGVGLSLVQRIIFDHNGTIEVMSKEREGSTFVIRLPQWIARRAEEMEKE
jgi:signal transduction histidine kinase